MKVRQWGKELEVHFYQYEVCYPGGTVIDDYLTTALSVEDARIWAAESLVGDSTLGRVKRVSIQTAQRMLDAMCVNHIRHDIGDHVSQ